MPEVKVQWVHENHLMDERPLLDYAFTGTVPILTLDQVEAWLKAEMEQAKNTAGWYGVAKIETLLVQVQAWRKETK